MSQPIASLRNPAQHLALKTRTRPLGMSRQTSLLGWGAGLRCLTASRRQKVNRHMNSRAATHVAAVTSSDAWNSAGQRGQEQVKFTHEKLLTT